MKIAIIVCMALMSFTSSANYELSENTIEYSKDGYPGKKKKKRKKNKKNKKRKKYCQKNARKNYAG